MYRFVETFRRFRHDERGVALILVTIMLPVIVGFALLAIDMSRVNNLHNDLQKGADAFAIAAAAELDGRADAWTRGERALANLIDNVSRFSTSGALTLATSGSVTVNSTYNACRSRGHVSWCFLQSIPANDATAITSANYASGTINTRFIEVKVNPQGFASIFPTSFIGAGNGTFNVGATAVAGFGSAVCDFTPVFICNPYEMVNGTNNAGGITLQQAAASRQYRRRLIELRKVGNGAAAGPGNFGFLEPPQGVGNGAQALAETIATSSPIGCYSSSGVTTKTGQNAGPVQDAFNVRFGIRANGNHFNSPTYGPASNVRKGAVQTQGSANQCPSYNQLTFGSPNMGLPRDPTWPHMGGRMGDGDWNLAGYWSTNFGATSYASGWSADKPTRFEVYRHEISAGLTSVSRGNVTGGEVGTPDTDCQPPIPISTVDRRLIYGAILNCQALTAAGNNLSGHSENLPVEAFASFFLTEPVSSPSDDASVMVELVDITLGGQGTLNTFLRDDVQLYR